MDRVGRCHASEGNAAMLSFQWRQTDAKHGTALINDLAIEPIQGLTHCPCESQFGQTM